MEFNEIKKVRREGQQKKITIPKNSKIEVGDFVMIKKIENGEREVPD